MPPQFLTFIEQKLHTDTNTEQRRALRNCVLDRLLQFTLAQGVNRRTKCANTGQNQFISMLNRWDRFVITTSAPTYSSALHRSVVADAIVDHCYHAVDPVSIGQCAFGRCDARASWIDGDGQTQRAT